MEDALGVFQVEKGRLKDQLFPVFTFLLSYLESKA